MSNGRVFFVTNEGNLQCMVVNRTFGKPWVVSLESTTAHRLAVRDGRVILIDIKGWLRCYDQRNGAHQLWSWSKDLEGEAAGRPILSSGRVYIALKSGRIRIFKTNGVAVQDYQLDSRICTPAFPVGDCLIVGCTDGTLRSIWYATGQERWRLSLGRAVAETDIALNTGSLIVLGKGNRLLRIDPNSKKVLATVQLPHPLHTGPVMAGDRVFTVVRKDLGRGRYADLLQAWRVNDLSPLWEYENGKPFRGPVSAYGTSVYLPASEGELLVF